ncbi:MAG: S9 family peptidase [Candidatus Neomarinimicrobiota bacterium]|nr:S9 family peptidase [Candidatus Neomarinimicrobiota bacterium]
MKKIKTPPDVTMKPFEIAMHGDTRIDNYYWMRLTDEQKSAKKYDSQTQEVVDYIAEENSYTQSSLSHTKKLQKTLYKEMVSRIKKDDESVPYYKNGYYYYTRFEENKEYRIHCRKKGSLDAKEEVILDENELAKGYDYFAVGGRNISPDNNWLAYGVDTLSRRIYEVHFKNLNTGEVLNNTISNSTGSVAWANDNQTVFYTSKNQTTLLGEKIWRHKVGKNTPDKMMYHEKDDTYYNGVYRSKSGKFIIIYHSSTLISDYQILSANNPDGKFKRFTPRDFDHEYSIDHYKDKFYIITNWQAKNNRLMETPDSKTSISNWKEVIPHRNSVHLLGMEIFKDHLVLNERKDGLRELRIIHQKNGKDEYINFGEDTYTSWISVNEEFDTNVLRYTYSSLVTPFSTYDYNMDTGDLELKKQDEVVGGYDQEEYTSKRTYATARDGKTIPISIVYRKDKKQDGPQNLLLYAYGAYGNTIDPYFSSTRLSLLDRGFVFAIAHVRGGQIYGRQSYDDGKMLNKKNTFYDFIDAGKYLIDTKYTDSDKLFAQGGSAGGLLIGAILNMEPSIWNGAIAAVPFVDAVTTMADPSIPLTSGEWDEWGDPREKKYYDYMLSYSPYDQIKNTNYPNILVTSGFFDSQVQYWEPLKYVAKLRDHWQGESNLYLHMNMDAGHGGKSGRFRRYKEYALQYAFLLDLGGVKK